MATVGARLTIPHVIGASAIIGQGSEPTPWILYSTSAVGATPTWTDATADLRRYATSRGRETELARVDPGRATIVLDDRDRTYDPDFNSAIRPLNRWWIREQFSGATRDVFVGYAEAYQEEWVAGAQEARTVVSCVDEFKRLNTARLPTMDPPRDTYADVVLFDKPAGYWRFEYNPETAFLSLPTVGSTLLGSKSGTTTYGSAPAIVGEIELVGTGNDTMQALQLTGAWASWDPDSDYQKIVTGVPDAPSGWYGISRDGAGDAAGQSTLTVEFWFKSDETPGANRTIARGPLTGGSPQWYFVHETDNQLSFFARNSGGTVYGSGSSPITPNVWYHVCGVVDGAQTYIVVNAVTGSVDSWTGTFGTRDLDDAGGTTFNNYWTIGDEAAPGGTRWYDEVAIYNIALTPDRRLAHYEAGALRGYNAQDPSARITSVLNTIANTSPRNLRASSRELTPVFMHGQPALDELRNAEAGEAVNAVLFIAKDGTITFLEAVHRSFSPWDTVQATFDDTDAVWWYNDIGTDYSDAFIANEWNVTREGGITQSASDATSISTYGPHTQSITGLPITTDAESASIAAAMLAKYKDPMRRIVRLEKLAAHPDVLDNLLQREIGDRIRILRHPPGGGSAKDQTAFIQKIEVEAEPGRPRRFVLSVSPL